MRILGIALSAVFLFSSNAFASSAEAEQSTTDSLLGNLTASVCLHNEIRNFDMAASYSFDGKNWQEITLVPHQTFVLWTEFREGSYPADMMIKFNSLLEGESEMVATVRPYISRRLRRNCSLSHKMKFAASTEEGLTNNISLVEMN